MNYRINPDRNIPWNNLPLLPISEPNYKIIDVYEQLGRAKEAMGLLSGRLIAIQDPSIFINSLTLQEAKDSNAIENIFTTDDDLYKAFSESKLEENISPAAKEVLFYREALHTGLSHLREKEAFDLDYFVKLYQVIKQTNDGIRPAFAVTVIRQAGTGPNSGKTVYTPPRGDTILLEKLNNLINFLNDTSASPMEPLLKMAIAHYQFEVIHPFRDGNGRVGRILNVHYVRHAGLLEYPVLYLSQYIIANKYDYYDKLAAVSQRGDWPGWLIYMLKGVEETSRRIYHKINDIIKAKERLLRHLIENTDIRNPELLVDSLFQQPYCKVNHLVDAGHYAENTARDYLNKLAEMRIVEKKVLSGRHYYVNLDLRDILNN